MAFAALVTAVAPALFTSRPIIARNDANFNIPLTAFREHFGAHN